MQIFRENEQTMMDKLPFMIFRALSNKILRGTILLMKSWEITDTETFYFGPPLYVSGMKQKYTSVQESFCSDLTYYLISQYGASKQLSRDLCTSFLAKMCSLFGAVLLRLVGIYQFIECFHKNTSCKFECRSWQDKPGLAASLCKRIAVTQKYVWIY